MSRGTAGGSEPSLRASPGSGDSLGVGLGRTGPELQEQGSATPGSSSRSHRDGSASGARSGLGNGAGTMLSCAQSSLCPSTAPRQLLGDSSPGPASQHGPGMPALSQRDWGYPEAASPRACGVVLSWHRLSLLCPVAQKPPKALPAPPPPLGLALGWSLEEPELGYGVLQEPKDPAVGSAGVNPASKGTLSME